MATASSTAETMTDPSKFAVSVAVGYAHVLDKVLGFLERTSLARVSPVLAVSFALPVLVAYLVVAALAFTVRVAADIYYYTNVTLVNNSRSSCPVALAWQAVALLQAAVVKLAVYLVLFYAFAVALLRFRSSVPSSLELAAL